MIKIDYRVLLKCYPGEVLFWAVGVIVGIVVLTAFPTAGGVIIGISIITGFLNLGTWKNHFAQGALLPAILVNPKKNLIAVLADFDRQGGSPYPVLKVVKRPLGSATGAPFKKADRLATVTTFHCSNLVSKKRWTDINPIAVNCATANKKTIKRAIDAIDEEEWELLMSVLKQMDHPFKPGIYPIDL